MGGQRWHDTFVRERLLTIIFHPRIGHWSCIRVTGSQPVRRVCPVYPLLPPSSQEEHWGDVLHQDKVWKFLWRYNGQSVWSPCWSKLITAVSFPPTFNAILFCFFFAPLIRPFLSLRLFVISSQPFSLCVRIFSVHPLPLSPPLPLPSTITSSQPLMSSASRCVY